MNDELTPQQRFDAEEAEDAGSLVLRQLLEHRDIDSIVPELVRLDWSPSAARAFVEQMANDLRCIRESPEARQQLLDEARTQLRLGVLLMFASGGLTALTMLAALAGAMPFFVVLTGLFLAGLIFTCRGLARWQFYRTIALPFDSPQSQNGMVEPIVNRDGGE